MLLITVFACIIGLVWRYVLAGCLVGCGPRSVGRPDDVVRSPARPVTAFDAQVGPRPAEPVPSQRPSIPGLRPLEIAAIAPELQLAAERSTSIGGPNHGRLEGAVALPREGLGFRFNPVRSSDARYGTVELVQLLMRAAALVQREQPGSLLTVNDLGLLGGGPIAHHGSHQAGRDVDVLFYMLDASGQPVPAVGAFLDPTGRGVDFHDLADPSDDQALRIDLPRTWALVRGMLEDEVAPVQRIFVAEHLRTLLLEHARTTQPHARTLQRFEDLTCQPSYPHDDHLHVRIFCSAEDIEHGCHDSRPMYPWRSELLRAAGVRPSIAKRPARAASVTTAAQARASATREAGTLDGEVIRWLAMREAWMHPPRTGRRYCP